MVIVAGHITVEPQQRESDLAGCVRIVEHARRAVGCLDVAICEGPGRPQPCRHLQVLGVAGGAGDLPQPAAQTRNRPAMLTVSVQECDIADVRPVFGKGAE